MGSFPIRKYFACASNDFLDRQLPVGKSGLSRSFLLMGYDFLAKKQSFISKNVMLDGFVSSVFPFGMEYVLCYWVGRQVCYLKANYIVTLIFELEIFHSGT